MKIKDGRINFFVGNGETTIEIIDSDSCTTFCKVKLTNDQLAALLSRQAHVKCDLEVRGLDRIGKQMVHKPHEFDITGLELPYNTRSEILAEKIKQTLPDGWVPDLGFASQNTFFKKDGRDYARTTIRTWI